MSFRLIKDGAFDLISSNQILSTSIDPTDAQPQSISSGKYEISFGPTPWDGGTTFVTDYGYVKMVGVQLVYVSGYVTMNSTNISGVIVFQLPYSVGSDVIGAVSNCYTSPTSPVTSICTCLEKDARLYIEFTDPVSRVDFTVQVMSTIKD